MISEVSTHTYRITGNIELTYTWRKITKITGMPLAAHICQLKALTIAKSVPKVQRHSKLWCGDMNFSRSSVLEMMSFVHSPCEHPHGMEAIVIRSLLSGNSLMHTREGHGYNFTASWCFDVRPSIARVINVPRRCSVALMHRPFYSKTVVNGSRVTEN